MVFPGSSYHTIEWVVDFRYQTEKFKAVVDIFLGIIATHHVGYHTIDRNVVH